MKNAAGIKRDEIPRPPIRRFEDLNVWKEAMRLCIDIYQALGECKDFGLRNQMQRSAVSIPSNIAEGFERGTTKEFIRFLRISKGSCAELRTQLYLAIKLHAIGREGRDYVDATRKVSSMLERLIQARLRKF